MIRYAKYSSRVPVPSDPQVAALVAEILDTVGRERDEAVRRYAMRFDGFAPERFAMHRDAIARAADRLDARTRDQIVAAERQVRKLARAQRATIVDFETELSPGILVGHRQVPVAAVGAYVPGVARPSVAAALTTTIFAREAGVERVIACAPPVDRDGPDPAVLFALGLGGADRVLCLGGAQAIAALSYGVEDVSPVDLIVGAGNPFVTEAKRQLFGHVGIETLAGPAEFLVIADESADPAAVSGQIVEHLSADPESPAWLITTSEVVAQSAIGEIDQRLAVDTLADARAAWATFGDVLICDSDLEAVQVADGVAARRIELHAADPDWFRENLHNYGTVRTSGAITPMESVFGDFQILPTAGAARFSDGLWVGSFLRALAYHRAAGIAPPPLKDLVGLPTNAL